MNEHIETIHSLNCFNGALLGVEELGNNKYNIYTTAGCVYEITFTGINHFTIKQL